MTSNFQQQVMELLTPTAKHLSEDIIFWRISENHPTVHYVKFFSDLACKINLKGEHDPHLAIAFLDELTLKHLQSTNTNHPLLLSDSPVLTHTSFQQRVVGHPSLFYGALSKTTEFMANRTYTTFPAYNCEFIKDDTLQETLYRTKKVVRWSDWSRSPSPALSARFRRTRTGIKSTGGKKMGIFSLAEIERIISHIIKEDGFIDIENFQRRTAHIELNKNCCKIILDEEQWTQNVNNLISWLHAFAVESVKSKE